MTLEHSPSDDTELIATTDEDGVAHYFEKLEEFELNGQLYALLLCQGSEEDEDEPEEGFDEEYLVMKVLQSEDAEGVPVFEPVEDEAEFELVVKHLETMDYEIDRSDRDDAEEIDPEAMRKLLEQLPHTETQN
jgi:uncharacterized protein YrzB (UPF0473 family)